MSCSNDLEARIGYLEDIEAIRGVIATYVYTLDGGDFDQLMTIYQPDAHFVIDAFQVDVNSADAIKPTLMGTCQAYRNMSHKIITIDVDPKSGTGRAYFLFTCIDVAQNQGMIGEGDYRYKFTKVDGQWKLSEQLIHIAYLSPAPWPMEFPAA